LSIESHISPLPEVEMEQLFSGNNPSVSLAPFLKAYEETVCQIRCMITPAGEVIADPSQLLPLAEQLGKLCQQSDSWSFEDLHKLAWAMQLLVLDLVAGFRRPAQAVAQVLRDALALTLNRLSECETRYRQRLALDDMISALYRVGKESN
jgi:hypothetical protein